MIKILYVVGSSAFGGAVKHVYDLCARLDRSQFDLVCVSPPDGPLPQELDTIGIRSRIIDLYEYANPGVWLEVISCLRQERPDIVHSHGQSAFLFAAFASPFAGGPIVVTTFHSLYLQEKIARMPLSALGRARTRVFIALERWAARRASQLVFVSEADRLQYCGASNGAWRSQTIPNGIDMSRFCPGRDAPLVRQRWGLDGADKVVGCVSRLSPEKGIEYLLRAFPTVVEAFRDARLLLVGDGPQRSELEGLARTLGFADRVVFTGHSSDVPALLSTMDVVALPSLWEGQPLAVLEAWAMEKPVVATAVRGTEYLVQDGQTGVLVPARDPASLASAIAAVLAAPENGARLGKAGRHVVESRFDLETTIREIGDLYKRVTGSRRRVFHS